MKRLLLLILALATVACLAACDTTPVVPHTGTPAEEDTTPAVDPYTSYVISLPAVERITNFVQFTMEGGATFVVELYPEMAPATVENFQHLVYAGFYNGLTFHRVIADFMIQGGDPNGNGTGSSSVKIKGEFSSNGYEGNTLKHERGVISMARSNSPDSASCQFFIVHADYPSLNGKYAAFGRVVAGMETVDTIASLEVTSQPLSGELSKPVRTPVIESAYFVDYVAPEAPAE
jgi:peptidylprolyl isomerase/peptidyl-prolyl cis-trans isomerase B (cyclophilin B)